MRRLNLEFIKKEFEKEGYKLLTNYVNSRQKLNYVCPNGHLHHINWADFKQGRRCRYCFRDRLAALRRMDFDYVKKSFEKENYKVLTTEYKNSDQKLDYICPNSHRHSISWHNWDSGWRCPFCHHEKLAIMFSGSGSNLWKGGISCKPYCDAWADKEYKESIKERDGYVCLNPVCTGKVRQLCIHHIDYNKKNCKPSNLITLCRSCNSLANKDRDWHTAWYQAIMKNRIEIRRN